MNDIDLRSLWPTVQFQTKPDCRAFAATEAYNLFRALNGLPPINVSESYIDTRARLDIGQNRPLLVESCLAVMQKWGCPTEDDWDNSNWGVTPPASVDAAASMHKVKSWGAIQITDPADSYGCLQAVYDSLVAGHPVTIGWGVTADVLNPVAGYIKSPTRATPIIGAHAVAIYGVLWSKSQVIIKNSWGAGWGDQGFGYLDFGWFAKVNAYPISSGCYIAEVVDSTPAPSFPPPTVNAMTIASIKALSNALVDPVTQAQKDQGLALFNALVVPVAPPVQPAGAVVVAAGTFTLETPGRFSRILRNGVPTNGMADRLTQVGDEVRAWQDSATPGVSWRWDGATWQRV